MVGHGEGVSNADTAVFDVEAEGGEVCGGGDGDT